MIIRRPMPQRAWQLSRWAAAAAVVAGLIFLAGCGGSASTKVVTQQARETPQLNDPDGDSAGSAPRVIGRRHGGSTHELAPTAVRHHRSASSRHRGAAALASGASAAPASAASTTHTRTAPSLAVQTQAAIRRLGGSRLNPCTLVTLAEAQFITSGSVRTSSEAALGPTCVYKRSTDVRAITLTVESATLSQVSHGISHPHKVIINGHRGVCGRLGIQMLLLPLSKGRLLNITAPCPIAHEFATRAVARIEA